MYLLIKQRLIEMDFFICAVYMWYKYLFYLSFVNVSFKCFELSSCVKITYSYEKKLDLKSLKNLKTGSFLCF